MKRKFIVEAEADIAEIVAVFLSTMTSADRSDGEVMTRLKIWNPDKPLMAASFRGSLRPRLAVTELCPECSKPLSLGFVNRGEDVSTHTQELSCINRQ